MSTSGTFRVISQARSSVDKVSGKIYFKLFINNEKKLLSNLQKIKLKEYNVVSGIEESRATNFGQIIPTKVVDFRRS
jgi:hypothetical protein